MVNIRHDKFGRINDNFSAKSGRFDYKTPGQFGPSWRDVIIDDQPLHLRLNFNDAERRLNRDPTRLHTRKTELSIKNVANECIFE
jgi:hypothetical protein